MLTPLPPPPPPQPPDPPPSGPTARVCQWHGTAPAVVFDVDGCWCSPECRAADKASAAWLPNPSMAALAFETAALTLLAGQR